MSEMVVSQDAKNPLKQSWFRSHIMLGSQAVSDMMLLPNFLGKKVLKVVFNKPSIPSFHFSSPLVCSVH